MSASPTLAQPEIVVTGRALPDPTSDRAYAIVEIARERLISSASGRLEDALRDVAGLQQFRRTDARSANPTSQGATLRGLGGNAAGRVLVLLDGVPQSDPFAGYVSWPAYLPERLLRARVTRGGGSGAAGAGALAGTIELDSLAGGERALAAVDGGSFGSVDARAVLGGQLGSGHGLVAGGYARGDGFVPVTVPGPADRGARYDQASLAARAVIAVAAGELQASLLTFDDIRTRGTAFSRNRTTGNDASLRYVGRRVELLGYIQTRRFQSQFASVDAARATAFPTLDQFNTPATGLGLKGELRPDIGLTELRIGGEWRRTEGTTNELFAFQAGSPTRIRRAGGASDIAGAFAEATRTLGALTLTGGGRIDHWSLTDGRIEEGLIGAPAATAFADRRGWAATGRGGAALTLTPALTLRAAAYLGWRLPTLNELYRPFRVGAEVTQANAALTPERSRGAEFGLRWQPAPRAQITVTGFAMTLDDAIANVTLSTTPALITRQRRNLARIASRGVEVDATFERGDWRLAASLAFADARVRDAASALNGLRPASVAPLQASATLGWRGLAMTGRYVSAQFDDDANTRRLGRALTLDLLATVPISERLSVRARIENSFDAQIEAARSAGGVVERAAPRTFWIGLRFAN